MVPHSQVPQQLGAIFLFAEIFSVLSLQLESSIPGCMLTEHQHTAAMQAQASAGEKVALRALARASPPSVSCCR